MARLEWTRPVSVGDRPPKELREAVAHGDPQALRRFVEAAGPFRTHKAWTDIAFWRGAYYCIFRVGTAHWSSDGHCELFRSEDSETWHPLQAPLLEGNAHDPKLLATVDRLIALVSATPHTGGGASQCYSCYTEDGQSWSAPSPCAPEALTLWYPKKRGSTYYAAAYGHGHDVELFASESGLRWDRVAGMCRTDTDREGETCLHFFEDGKALAVVRQGVNIAPGWADLTPNMCKVIRCEGAPYTEWHEQRLAEEVSIEGQQCLGINGALYVCGRNFHRAPIRRAEILRQTALFRFDGDCFTEELVLPSGGDTGYCGMLVRPDGKLLVSYYTGTRERADVMVSLVDVASLICP